MIKILKASAGSGKTWNLALQYIRLLLGARDRYAYRHILAVTFTNKATDEMKERILDKLHELATRPADSDYFGYLVPSVCPDDKSLQKAAGELLCNILHDYSAFAVSTIDRFFQQTLKAFSREIGHFASYSIELDKTSLLRESVDRFLDSLTDDREHERSLEWMTRKTMSQLEEGEGYRLEYTLRQVAERFNSEEYRVALEKCGVDEAILYSDDRLDVLQNGCDSIIDGYAGEVVAAAQAVADSFEDAGLDMDDTYSRFMSKTIMKYQDLKSGSEIKAPSEAFMNRAADTSKWFSAKNRRFEDMITGTMVLDVLDFLALFETEFKVYNTAVALKKQIYGFAVANDLYRNYQDVLKDKNVLTIDQTNILLRNIIDGTDAPFIYEKTGVRFEHFLLDEFQDTSMVQWDNFRPLLHNSVSQGFDNLIVGDVKQSIYRWRQSDWGLLEHQVQESFPDISVTESLDTNFRSCHGIVSFNNQYFKAAAEYLDGRYGDDCKVVSSIYSDVAQKSVRKEEGLVEVMFCDNDMHYISILEAIERAVEAGYRLGDITILVRLNSEGAAIAEYLVDNGVHVLSDDSLKVSSSLTVRRLVAILAGIENPEDTMASFLARTLEIEIPRSYHSLIDLCESLLRQLHEADMETFEAETLYIQSFMDIVQEFVNNQGNGLRQFLKKWAEDKSNISSPKSDDAVRIMTVHKSKGLDFPYVIFPSLESVGFFAHGNRWVKPDVDGTALEDIAEGVYDVHLSGKSESTLFESRYREEMLLQYVDNINILYVAFTRAAKAMSIISAMPRKVSLTDDGYEGNPDEFTMFSQWTMAYMATEGRQAGFQVEGSAEDGQILFRKGSFPSPDMQKLSDVESLASGFESFRERGRLKFSEDALDFFAEDGSAGIAASNRVKGVVLHDILARVVHPSDLGPAIREAVAKGDVTADDAPAVLELLESAIDHVKGYEWFPDSPERVLNESDLISPDGRVLRPDRVVISDGKVRIVDYKFGEHRKVYERQVTEYASIWRRLGYEDVSAYLWYVQTGQVMRIL